MRYFKLLFIVLFIGSCSLDEAAPPNSKLIDTFCIENIDTFILIEYRISSGRYGDCRKIYHSFKYKEDFKEVVYSIPRYPDDTVFIGVIRDSFNRYEALVPRTLDSTHIVDVRISHEIKKLK